MSAPLPPILITGNMLDVLPDLPEDSFDACVTDPPYHLSSIVSRFGASGAKPTKPGTVYARSSAGFMGQTWDGGDVAMRPETWAAVLRVLKPGGHLIAFGGSRTHHRIWTAIEDAGFEIRDTLFWLYGSGFPKSHDVSKDIDKRAGAEREVIAKIRVKSGGMEYVNRTNAAVHGFRPDGYQKGENILDVTVPATDAAKQWEGWGTALKPSTEPIVLARKPLVGTVAENIQRYGTGALNIDACRVALDPGETKTGGFGNGKVGMQVTGTGASVAAGVAWQTKTDGRWPANLVHDGSPEVTALFPDGAHTHQFFFGENPDEIAARFFWSPKASKQDRGKGNFHPTVKPTELMRYLCRLVTPPDGIVLDPFMGSGSTGKACGLEGFDFIGVELNAAYVQIAEQRLRRRT